MIVAAGALLLGNASAQSNEGPTYTDTLPAKPHEITRTFLVDHTAWNAYAHAHYNETKDLSGPEAAYRRLINLYCGPGKQHQGITFGNDPDFDPERSEIVFEKFEDGEWIIHLRHTGQFDFVAEYNFVFKRKGDAWRLDEVYYYDDYGKEWLPRL
ncbi:hypothetical protein [Erythrobacter sp. F6033]|uniref:hypothetical protein n=1 Tax=Erythrobacter sp. F6033 TaxID=2926401 RepID=UPI001FF3563E|nr:hypothetical protein [Erythrobacter sp. F6033]MCK0127434.1 hypothetical protein [Erythrobacter sp. F6033]